jgi:thiamine-phosphate pyrophosphorylase
VRLLYVTDRAAIGEARFEHVLDALSGASGLLVQLREKFETDRNLVDLAKSVREKLGGSVPLFVNRRFDVALAAGADGVHLPADGLPVSRVRAGSPRGFRIGVSTHSVAEAVRAIDHGADLVVLGPVFDTPSKREFGPPLGTRVLAGLPRREAQGADVFVIGGIDESRIPELVPFADRISGVAGIRLIQEAAEPRAVVERIVAA